MSGCQGETAGRCRRMDNGTDREEAGLSRCMNDSTKPVGVKQFIFCRFFFYELLNNGTGTVARPMANADSGKSDPAPFRICKC